MDGATVRAWATGAARALADARAPIDSLNVFPVPDGDTGTNLALTVTEGAEHVADAGADAGAAEVAAAFARGALLGARGNSGVIVSQYLHGFARGLATGPPTHGQGCAVLLASALDQAQRAAREAVAHPVEGTILTAASAAASAADVAARRGADAGETASAAVAGAREALARSRQTLDVLRAAGVVDAGATGLVVLLGALAGALEGDASAATTGGSRPEAADGEVARRTDRTAHAAGTAGRADTAAIAGATREAATAGTRHPARAAHAGPLPPEAVTTGALAVVRPADIRRLDGAAHSLDDGEFEVMYVVEPGRPGGAERDLAPMLSTRLQRLGTSVAVVGGADGWHVHVHTDDPAAAVAAGDLGARSQIVVRRLAALTSRDGLGVVAGTGAPGLLADLARVGALVMVHGDRPVTARDVRRAVVDTGEDRVVVLPGSVPALTAAQATAASSGPRVDVLDATDEVSVVVALTAAAGGGPGDRVAGMRAALAAVRTGSVDRPDVDAVVARARDLLADGGEVVTVLRGAALAEVAPGDTLLTALTDALGRSHPDVEVVVLPAGQAAPAAVLAVE